jgi:hypothetical protein
MPKYRGWVAQVLDREEFATEPEARAWAMSARDKWKTENPSLEIYFEVDDCGSEEENE